MFCVQCEQTIRTPAGNGCSYAQGMCGKTAETSDLQDLLIATLQGLSAWAVKAREYGIINHDVDSFAPRAFFSTLTNVNFDSPRIVGYAREAIALREALKAQCLAVDANARVDNPMADLQLVSDDLGELQRQAAEFTPNKDKAAIGENILGLRLLCLGQSLLACLLFCAQACICGGKINGLPVVCLGRLFGLCPHGGRCCGGGRALRCRRFRRGLRLGRCRGAALYGNCGFSRRGADTGVIQRVQRLQVAVVLLRAGKAHLLCLYQLLQGAYL